MRKHRDAKIINPRGIHVRPVSIIGTGCYLPERVVTNADLEKVVDTTNEWIVTRTGIRERRVARHDQAASDLATEAARRAMADAKVTADEIDLIIVASITPDMVFPSTACFVQHNLDAKNAFCFDIQEACSGFLYSMEIAQQFVSSGKVKTALIIGAEKLSCVLDWQDRSTCVLFGDGSGAAVLRACGAKHGILSSVLGADGSLSGLLKLPGGGSRHPTSEETLKGRLHFMQMTGREVFKHAVTRMTHAAQDALKNCNLSIEDVDCIIPHQANLRIIDAIGERLGAPREKYFINLDRYGNMSAASIPVALDEASKTGRLKKGDIVLMVAFGGGFTWGATVVEWIKG